MPTLSDFIKEADNKSPFLKFTDSVPVKCTYIKSEVIPSTFDPEKKTVQYTVEVEGNQKTFTSMSMNLGRQMVGLKEGQLITLTKSGSQRNTKWTVMVINQE